MEPATALSPVPSPTPSPAPSKNLITKLVRALSILENAKKDGFNEHSRYNYVTIDSLAAIARKALSKEGLVLLADVVERETVPVRTMAGKEAWSETVMVRYTLSDGESSFQFSMPGIGHDSSDKSLPKAISNSRKYAILSLLNLGGEDPETETLETTRATVAPKSTPKPVQPALVRPAPQQTPLLTPPAQPQPVEPTKPVPTSLSAATDRQKNAILAVGRTLNLDEPTIEQLLVEHYGHPMANLTRKEASDFLDRLKREQNSPRH
jgi:predicted component of type VI protein secretion system